MGFFFLHPVFVIARSAATWQSPSPQVRPDSQKKGTDCHVGLRPPRNDKCWVRCFVLGAVVDVQRDGRPVPYTLTGVGSVIFTAAVFGQRAGLEPAPTVGDGVCWMKRKMFVNAVGVGFPDPVVRPPPHRFLRRRGGFQTRPCALTGVLTLSASLCSAPPPEGEA